MILLAEKTQEKSERSQGKSWRIENTLAATPLQPGPPNALFLLIEEALNELQNLQKYRAEHHKQHHQKQECHPVNVEIDGSSWICMKTTLEKTGFSDGQRSVEASV